jgi:hypothetical protein
MWYYVLFAIVTFTRGSSRIWLTGAVILFLGPKIIVLAPVWVLGVFLHRYTPLTRLAQWQSWALFLISWPLYGLFQHYEMTEYGSKLLLRAAAFSKYFITDYLLALIIGANFVGFRGIAHHFSMLLLPFEGLIRWLAGFTFSLYILHQPLLQFYAAIINGDPSGPLFYLAVMTATLASVVLIGMFTEQKRFRLRSAVHRRLVMIMATKWWRQGLRPLIAKQTSGDVS